MKALVLAAGLVGLFAPSLARADKVELDIKVVEASTHGKDIDPKLRHMQADFGHKGFAYSSYKLATQVTPTLEMKATTEVALPNGRTVKLTPLKRDPKGNIEMHVSIPGLLESLDYSVGNRGTYFLGAGPNGHGSPNESRIFLVIQHTAK